MELILSSTLLIKSLRNPIAGINPPATLKPLINHFGKAFTKASNAGRLKADKIPITNQLLLNRYKLNER